MNEVKFDVIKIASCYSELGLVPITKLPKLALRLLNASTEDISIIHIHKNGKYDYNEVKNKFTSIYGFNNFMYEIIDFFTMCDSDTGYVILKLLVEKDPNTGKYSIPTVYGPTKSIYIPTAKVTKGNTVEELPVTPIDKVFKIDGIIDDGRLVTIKLSKSGKEIVDKNNRRLNISFNKNFSVKSIQFSSDDYTTSESLNSCIDSAIELLQNLKKDGMKSSSYLKRILGELDNAVSDIKHTKEVKSVIKL